MYLEKAVEVRRRTGSHHALAASVLGVGLVYSSSGDYPNAERYLFEALETYRTISSTDYSKAVMGLGTLYVRWKKWEEAQKYLEEARALQESSGDTLALCFTLVSLAWLRYELGDMEGEIALYQKVLPLCKEINNVVSAATALLNMVESLHAIGTSEPEELVFLTHLAYTIREQNGIPNKPSDQEWRDTVETILRPSMGEAAYQSAVERGRTTNWKNVF
jgi:tetratricopeptide (TPR) repeat protein